MRCSACQAENPPDASRCAACGAALAAPPPPARPRPSSGRRGLAEDTDTPFGPLPPAGPNRTALLAYRLAVAGLVPGLGLLLGPLALALGWLARRRGRGDAAFTARSPAAAAVALGAVLTLANWSGLALMIAGWRAAHPSP
jgi:hypothetical protein